jgi:hypothetical protein
MVSTVAAIGIDVKPGGHDPALRRRLRAHGRHSSLIDRSSKADITPAVQSADL